MKIGVTLRNMGPQSSRETLAACATAIDDTPIESIWITDHIAIPPDDAEGSGGRYLDTLSTLAWLGGLTERVKLASGVLILPYRPILPIAKQVATIAELTNDRLIFGIGVGWMAPEFKALGVDRRQRGKLTDDYLSALTEAFSNDVIEHNGQPFIFAPRPPMPELLIGGAAPIATARALRHNAGWLPMARAPEQIAEEAKRFSQDGGRSITVMSGISQTDSGQTDSSEAAAQIDAWRELGIDRLVCALRYDTTDQALEQVTRIAELAPRP